MVSTAEACCCQAAGWIYLHFRNSVERESSVLGFIFSMIMLMFRTFYMIIVLFAFSNWASGCKNINRPNSCSRKWIFF